MRLTLSCKRLFALVIAAVVLVGGAACANAQSAALGGVAGIVRDSAGAVVANAKVLVTNSGTGATQTVTTDSQGHYTASHQFAGHGRVTFIAQTISDSIALAGQSNRLTLTI